MAKASTSSLIARNRSRTALVVQLAASIFLSGCAVGNNPENVDAPLFSPEKAAPGIEYAGQVGGFSPNDVEPGVCPAASDANFVAPATPGKHNVPDSRMRYSRGDRFNITVPGVEGFSGDYMINADGRVILPFAEEIMAVGLTNAELSKRIEDAFIRAGILNTNGLRIAVRPVQYAPINIFVTGAVFQPGRTTINNIKDSDKTDKALTKFGDTPLERYIASGLRAAGGVRPDADLSNIILIRGNSRYRLDWRGAFIGGNVDDVPLIDNDKIIVAESACFQTGLIRPSQITPPGIRIFISNLTVPATSNSSSSIGQYSNSIPYGTRFLQALVSANCVGGIMATNAPRQAVLISRNPKTLRTEVVQRSIEELVRSADRDAVNPHLMPDDAVACYDSTVTETRDVMATLQQFLNGAVAQRAIIAPWR